MMKSDVPLLSDTEGTASVRAKHKLIYLAGSIKYHY